MKDKPFFQFSKDSSLLNETSQLMGRVIDGISHYLIKQAQSGNYFNERRFYSDTFLAASLNLLNKEIKLQKKLIKTYGNLKNDNHREFNFFALQIYNADKLKRKVKFSQIFIRKVTNWVLLRALVRYKQGGVINKFLSIIEALLVLRINRFKGYFTDNTLRMFYARNRSISSQYHAFATLLVGELYLETGILYFKEEFLMGLKTALSEVSPTGYIQMKGRGKQQIFGYACFIYSFVLGYNLTKNRVYLKNTVKILTYLKSFQSKMGKVPLVLFSENEHNYWLSYNNFNDYEAFLLLLLLLSRKKLLPAYK